VQTCIVNKDKRHAFVKMVSRKDAVNAKESMEGNRAPDSQLRVRTPRIPLRLSHTMLTFEQTRWGVGFGPRDCSDYQTGVSIIPISKLTDADRKWMLTAEYGGSGGKPIEGGLVVEEPDIEIGQGVSSKAISRRMQTDKGGNHGPKSSRDRDDDEGPPRRGGADERRRDERRMDAPTAYQNPTIPSIPGFPPYAMLQANGMPMFPPGFVFPGQPQQPPPPGR
jgi:protein NRD1